MNRLGQYPRLHEVDFDPREFTYTIVRLSILFNLAKCTASPDGGGRLSGHSNERCLFNTGPHTVTNESLNSTQGESLAHLPTWNLGTRTHPNTSPQTMLIG